MITSQLKNYIYVFFLVILTGCVSFQNHTVPNSKNTVTTYSLITSSATSILKTVSTKPSITPTLSKPIIKPTQTYKPEPSPTYTLEASKSVVPVCVENGQIISPTNFGIAGTIIYQKDWADGLYAIGGNPLTQMEIVPEEKMVSVYGFSPDGMWLAYAPELGMGTSDKVVFGTPVMILLSASGERIEQKINIDGLETELLERCVGCEGFHFFDSMGEWINNSLIYVSLGARSNEEGGPISSLPKVFDPFTGNWQFRWFDNLPGVYDIFPERAGFHHIKLSPDLSRVLYPANFGGIVLRDVIQGIEVWSDSKFYGGGFEEITWSPDSKMVAVVNIAAFPTDHRLLLISRDGEVTDVVNAEFPQPGLSAASLTWSPDSRYLAFAGTLDSEINLYVYDTRLMRYLNHCSLPGVLGGYPSLVWSPNDQWIAFDERTKGTMRLLNVQSGEVVELLENAIPVGWSDKYPVREP